MEMKIREVLRPEPLPLTISTAELELRAELKWAELWKERVDD